MQWALVTAGPTGQRSEVLNNAISGFVQLAGWQGGRVGIGPAPTNCRGASRGKEQAVRGSAG